MAALSRGCKPRRCDRNRKNPDFDIYSETFQWIHMELKQVTPNRVYLTATVALVNILDRNCRLRTLEMPFQCIKISKVCGDPSKLMKRVPYNSTIANWSLLQVEIFKPRKDLFVMWWKFPHADTSLLDELLGQSTVWFCYRLQCCRYNITECTTEWKIKHLSSLQAFDLKNERNLCIVSLDIQS